MDKTESPRAADAARDETAPPRKPLGQWLLENMPQGVEIELPDRSSKRPTPLVDQEEGE